MTPTPHDPNDPSHHDPLNFDDEDLLTADSRLPDDDDNDHEPKGVSLADIWRNNPSLKIFAVVLVIGIFLIVFLVFGKDEEANVSTVGSASGVNQPPGTAQLPPAYEDAVKAASEQRAVNAEMTGGSAIPTPIGTTERIEAPPSVENVDPLAEWRRAAEERASQRRETEQVSLPTTPPVDASALAAPPVAQTVVQQQIVQQPVPQGPPPLPSGPNPQDVTQLSQRLADYMKSIIDSQAPHESALIGVGIPSGFEISKETVAAQQLQAAQQAAAEQTTAQKPPKMIIPAGTIAYAQTLIEANSDVPGPVLAELASGPLSGARLLGSFQPADEYMVLRFNRAIYKGKEYAIDAYALDPATTLPGMATDVDHHYFSRILIPAAARFIQGYAQAISQRGSTVVVNNSSTVATTDTLNGRQSAYQGAAEAANQAATIVQQDSTKPVTIKVAAGTRMGLLFTTSLTEAAGDPTLAGTPAYVQQQQAARIYTNQQQLQEPGLNPNALPATSTGVPATNYPVPTGQSTYPGYTNNYPYRTQVLTTGTPIR